jgi:hypothetical protein
MDSEYIAEFVTKQLSSVYSPEAKSRWPQIQRQSRDGNAYDNVAIKT